MKLTITKEKFLEMYNTMTNAEIMQILGMNHTRYYHMIKTLGLSKQKGPKRKYSTYEFTE